MQIDLLIPEFEGRARAAIGGMKLLNRHAQHVAIERRRPFDRPDGQDEVVQGSEAGHLQLLCVLVSMRIMTETPRSSQTLTCVIDPARASALQAALGMDQTIESGSTLPPFFHHIYFWDPQPPENLGRDGHPALGGFVPDMGLPRRMWAAGRLLFHAPMRAGIKAEKTAQIESVTRKDGKSGPLAFVRIRHDIRQRGATVLSEWQDLVYREDSAAPPDRPIARRDETHTESVDFDSTLLFRYSALTMNGHRIHYDHPYAKRVEKYDNLVVHGPLLAQHLMLMGERILGRPLTEVTYRATAPLTLPGAAELCWKDGGAWVRDATGAQFMEAAMR